jgi:PAS domain S-box-containing protein
MRLMRRRDRSKPVDCVNSGPLTPNSGGTGKGRPPKMAHAPPELGAGGRCGEIYCAPQYHQIPPVVNLAEVVWFCSVPHSTPHSENMSQRLIFETFRHTLHQGLADLDRLIIVTPIETVVLQATDRLQSVNDRPTVLDDLAAAPQTLLKTVLQSRLPENPDCSAIALPLIVDHQILGAVYFERVNPVSWTDSQIGLLQGICDQMAIALYYFQPRIEPLEAVACNLARTFQQLVENANDIIFMITIDGRFSYLSPKFQDLVGADPQSYINQSFSQLTHPDDLPEIERIMQLQLFNREEVSEFEFRLRRSDGSYIWASANNSAPIEDESGNLIGFQGIVRDINTRKTAEQELQHAKERLQFLIATTPAIIHSVSLKSDHQLVPGAQKISYISENVEKILGYKPSEIMDDSMNRVQLIHPDDRDRLTQLYTDAIASRGEYQAEYRFLNQQGEYQWLYSAVKVLVDEAGQPIEAVGYTADITPRRLAEDQLLQTNNQLMISNAELAHATRLKDEFLANMSHELRTPLNAVLGISEAMLDEVYGPLSEQYRKSIKIIEQSGQHLLELINDILDLAKIEAGKLEIRRSNTSLKHLCESSLCFVRQIAINKHIQLLHHDTYGANCIEVDERRMRQVLINLLSNAVKFTPSGGTVELVAEYDAREQQFAFQIRDTGIGIAAANLAQLFQPFIQIDSSLNRQFSGTGLGLTLVKRIIDLHCGTIAVDSTETVGTCFTIALPIGQFSPALHRADPIAEIQAIKVIHPEAPRILLAEDNAMNIEIMTDYLNAQGYEVIGAKNGIEAIALTHSHHPQLILMDIQMPRMDGLEATRQIRQDSQYAHIPIIALTALAMPGDADRCREAGANDYLAKPVKLKQLAAAVERHLAAFAY